MVRPLPAETSLTMEVPEHRLSLARLLLGFGIAFEAPSGIRVSRFLQAALGADAHYIENRIQTLFMDGHAVDTPGATYIRNPCSLAVSAAMPGVFGAAFRKQGTYSGLRRRETEGPADNSDTVQEGQSVAVTVKCFNQVAADLGADLLAHGVTLETNNFLGFWNRHGSLLADSSRSVHINERKIPIDQLAQELEGKNGRILLKIHPRPALQGA